MRDMLKNTVSLKNILTARIFKKRFVISVTFLCTYRCNFRCRYCDIWNLQNNYEMSKNEIFSMIDEFCRMGLRRFSFNGGEPLLRDDLGELISYAKQKGLFTTVFTNGSLVAKRINDLRPLDVLLISLDGKEEAHDKNRQPGSYKGVIEAIKSAKAAGINVWTNTVITKYNLAHLDFILDLSEKFGFKTIFQPAYFYPHSSTQSEIDKLKPEDNDYKKTIDILIERKKRNANIVHSIRYLEYIREPNWDRNKRTCWASKLYCAVTPDGEVAPCFPEFNSRNWPNGRKIGFKNAYSQIPEFACNGCYCILVENDFVYSLFPDAVLNISRNI